MNSNSKNPRVGRLFQIQVQQWFQAVRKEVYQLEVPIAIGNPAKPHKFDLANSSGKTVVECKCYTWTETGNVPSAKMQSINEAAFYLSFLPYDVDKCIRFLYKGIIINHNKTEPTYTKTSLFLCEKRRFFVAWFWKGVVLISN